MKITLEQLYGINESWTSGTCLGISYWDGKTKSLTHICASFFDLWSEETIDGINTDDILKAEVELFGAEFVRVNNGY